MTSKRLRFHAMTALGAAAVLTLSGCGGSDSGGGTPNAAPTDKVLHISFLQDPGQPPDPDIFYAGQGLLLTTNLYHAAGDPRIVVPLFLVTLTLAGVFFGYLRVTTGSIWPVAGAHAAVNVAWGISMEVSQTKSKLVLEYIGGESGILMICGLLAADAVLIRKLRIAARGARA